MVQLEDAADSVSWWNRAPETWPHDREHTLSHTLSWPLLLQRPEAAESRRVPDPHKSHKSPNLFLSLSPLQQNQCKNKGEVFGKSSAAPACRSPFTGAPCVRRWSSFFCRPEKMM